MANKPLYGAGGKPIYGVGGKPVYGELMMHFYASHWAIVLYDIGDITSSLRGDNFEDYITRGVLLLRNDQFSSRNEFYSVGASTFCNKVEATCNGGWAWHGTYWEYVILSWDFILWDSGSQSYPPPSDVLISIYCNNKHISQTFTRYGITRFEDHNPRDSQLAKVRYTPSTDVLEFV